MINVFQESDHWEVWSDTEASPKDGRCIGDGQTKEAALQDALAELTTDMNTVIDLIIEEKE